MPRDRGTYQLKARTFELFIEHGDLRPDEWAMLADFHPISSAWSYLLRQHRIGNLRRGRDRNDRIVYRIGPKGAQWFLWWKAQGYSVKVRSS